MGAGWPSSKVPITAMYGSVSSMGCWNSQISLLLLQINLQNALYTLDLQLLKKIVFGLSEEGFSPKGTSY